MGLMDKVSGLLKGRGEQVDGAIDKVAEVVDDKTGGKHTDKIDKAVDKAKQAVDKLDPDSK